MERVKGDTEVATKLNAAIHFFLCVVVLSGCLSEDFNQDDTKELFSTKNSLKKIQKCHGCFVDGKCYPNEKPKPGDPNKICYPMLNIYEWTDRKKAIEYSTIQPIKCTPATLDRMNRKKEECSEEERWVASEGCVPKSMVKLYEECEKGKLSACFDAGEEFYSGKSLDVCRGTLLFMKICDEGFSKGCSKVGHILLAGNYFERRPGQGIAWLTKGCEAKDVEACVFLGEAYERMRFVKCVDTKRASYFYKIACDAGHKKSCESFSKTSAEEAETDPETDRGSGAFKE